jgi:hypothetical protein
MEVSLHMHEWRNNETEEFFQDVLSTPHGSKYLHHCAYCK